MRYLGLFFIFWISACTNESDGLSVPGPTGIPGSFIDIEELVGLWEARSAVIALPTSHIGNEIVTSKNKVILEVQFDGRFVLAINRVEGKSAVISGQFSTENGIFLVHLDDSPGTVESWQVQLRNDLLKLRGPLPYDVNEDGFLDPAEIVLDLIRG